MDKQKLIKRLSALFLSGAVLLSTTVIFAITQNESLLALTYANYKDKLQDFTSKVWFGNDLFGFGSESLYLINSLVQAIFWVTKFIFSICTGIYELLKGGEEFNKYLDKILGYAATIYSSLGSVQFGLLPFFLILTACYAYYIFAVKNANFFKPLLIFFLIFGFNSWFFGAIGNGQYGVKTLRNSIQTIASDFTNKIIEHEKALEIDSLSLKSEDAMLELYFKVAIWEPFRYMNADIGKNDEDNNGFVLSDRQLQHLISYKSGDDSFRIGNTPIKELAGTVKEPKNKMLKDNWGLKFSYAVASLFDVIALGMVVSGVGITRLALDGYSFILLIIAPIVMILSLFPTFENVLFNFIKKLVGAIFISSVLIVIGVFIFYYYVVMANLIKNLVGGNLILSALLRLGTIVFAYKKRDFIISIFSADRIAHLGNNFTRRLSHYGGAMKRKASQNAMERLKRASRGANQLRRGALKVGSRKAKEASRRAIRRFKPKSYQDSKAQLYVRSMKDSFRKDLALKDKTLGKFRGLRAEGVKDKNSAEYHDLKQRSEESLERGKEREKKSLGYRQRKHNLEAKQRLKKLRQYRKNRVKPVMPVDKTKATQNPVKVKPVLKTSAKENPLKDRRQSKNHIKLQDRISKAPKKEKESPVKNPFLVEKDFKLKGAMFVDEKRTRPGLRPR